VTQRSNYKLWIACSAGLLLVAAGAAFLWFLLRPCQHGPYADVSWQRGGGTNKITCHVVDVDGSPLSSMLVYFDDNLGGDGGMTSADGRVVVSKDRPEVPEIKLNGLTIMDRRWAGALMPSAADGLQVTIVVKDVEEFRRRVPQGQPIRRRPFRLPRGPIGP
jgi:hypothetical protein